jgi:hypothetical protein
MPRRSNGRPSHPPMAATLLMVSVGLFLVIIATAGVMT